MPILVIAEHDNQQLKDATLSVIHAATLLGDDIRVLLAGHDCSAVARQLAAVPAINEVLVCDQLQYAHALAENLSALVFSIAQDYSHILAAADTFGKNFMPRVAALLDMAQISDIVSIQSGDTFVRPIYAGNALATVQSTDNIKLITVRSSAFERAEVAGGHSAIITLDAAQEQTVSSFVSQQLTQSERPELGSARVVISGGRGMASRENFALLEALADKLDGAIGASRAAVDAGFVPNDYQVGQTGKIVAPDLYLAVGISGAIQHLAGMSGSKVIVAINKDEEAPIFQVADYGLVADLFDVLPQLAEEL